MKEISKMETIQPADERVMPPQLSLKKSLNALLNAYSEDQGTTSQASLRDMLTDLRHIADDLGLDFDDAGIASEELYNEESVSLPAVAEFKASV